MLPFNADRQHIERKKSAWFVMPIFFAPGKINGQGKFFLV